MENINENVQQETKTEEVKKENILKRGLNWVKGHKGAVAGVGTGLLAAAAVVAKVVVNKDADDLTEETTDEALTEITE